MQGVTIHPSMKMVKAAYTLAILILAAAVWAWYEYGQEQPAWLIALPLVALLPALRMHFRTRLTTLRLHDDHLTLETGLFSRTRRTVDTAKIQDVTVKQTITQRLLGTGDLTLESAGERGAMLISNLDRPRQIADAIINSSKRSTGLRPFGGLG